MKLFVNSETGPLQAVLMGHMDRYEPGPPLNSVQRHYFAKGPPRKDLLLAQYEGLAETLARHGVRVYRYDPAPDNLNRPFARDAVVVMGSAAIRLAMKNRAGPLLPALWRDLSHEPVEVDRGVLEGGDILQDENEVFVGIGERSNSDGLAWLTEWMGDRRRVTPIHLAPGILHLDVVFNPVGRDAALIYPPGIRPESLAELERRYRLLPVTAEEQFGLGVNLLSLSPEKVISLKGMDRINRLLVGEGIEVVRVVYDEVVKLGGGFRCSTVALARKPFCPL